MPQKAVEILDRETIFEGFFKLSRLTLRHELFGGGWSAEMQRELFQRDPVVALLPYDPIADKVLLIE